MKQKLLIISVVFLFVIGLAKLQAQEAIPTSGGSAYGNAGTVVYTAGQTVYTVNSDVIGSVAQGIQQPYDATGDPNHTDDTTLACSVYPNPVTDYLTLEIQNYLDENVNYYISDVTGKLLKSGKVKKMKTMISMFEYVGATYYLKAIQDGDGSVSKKMKVFKIIKK